jgi:PAS domain S-box-containing protein
VDDQRQIARPSLDDPFAMALAEATESLVCVLDRDGTILFFNHACVRATGFPREEVVGRDACESVIPPEERSAFRELLAYLWKTGFSSPRLGHWMTRAGGRRVVSWSNRLMVDAQGEPLCLVTAGHDLTDRERPAEAQRAEPPHPELRLAEAGRLALEQRALRRVATLVASEVTPERVFDVVSEECALVLDVSSSAVMRYEADGTAIIVARHSRDGRDAFTVGSTVDTNGESSVAAVRRTGAPSRIEDWRLVPGEFARDMVRTGYRSTASAPIVVGGRLWGAVTIASAEPLAPHTETRLGAFCELVSLAVASAQARTDLYASRARVLKAGDEQRRRLERNLHDGAQQRLVALSLLLRVAQARLRSGADDVPQLLDQAAQELDAGLAELREIARGLHPSILTAQGLLRALESLADRVALPVELDVPQERLPPDVEAAAYYIVSEALTNVSRHAEATSAAVRVHRDGDVLRIEVADDGRGGVDPSAGSGVVGLRDRAEAIGGALRVVSPPGRGTVVMALLPITAS